MKKMLIMMIVCMLSCSCFADSFNSGTMTEKQVVEMEAYAAELKLKEMANPMQKAQEVSEWVAVGEQLGKGIAGCAKELGVEVNSFVTTPVGKMTAIVIVWKFIGRDLMHFGGGALLFSVMLTFWIYFYRRMCLIKSVSFGESKVWYKFRNKTVAYYGQGEVDETRGIMAVILVIIIAISALIMFL